MQNLVNNTSEKKNYEFVDAIRAIAMLSIVAEHSFFFNDTIYHPSNPWKQVVFSTSIQLVKFGTISFFLIAGFLIGEKFTEYTPLQYLKRRIKNTVTPWLFWSLFFVMVWVVRDIIVAYRFNGGHLYHDFSNKVIDHFRIIYIFSNYWFIPNFLCCITILLIFRRYLYSNWLGNILLIFTLLYAVNIYTNWFEPRHPTAILGFVFFLWLGAQFNRDFKYFESQINKLSVWFWLLLTLVTLIIGVKESLVLRSINSVDPYNSLRISNILYSLSCFFLLIRVKNLKVINVLKPRETTYGIYLIHYILVDSLLPEIFRPIRKHVTELPLIELIGYQLLRFVIVYAITFALVRALNYTKLKWMVGR